MPRAGMTIFLVFFGIAVLDAFSHGRWARILFWVIVGAAFALLDWWGQRKRA